MADRSRALDDSALGLRDVGSQLDPQELHTTWRLAHEYELTFKAGRVNVSGNRAWAMPGERDGEELVMIATK